MLDDRIQRTELAPSDWGRGRPEAPVTLLEYGDFECPHCGAVRPVLESLITDYPEMVRLVFRHFPVSTTHPHALIAAEASEAAGAQGRFWEMHDQLFTHQDALEPEDLREYARAIGLDLARFDRELAARTHEAKVKSDFRKGVRDGVNGTPTIFLNRARYDGLREEPHLLAAISRLMRESPTP